MPLTEGGNKKYGMYCDSSCGPCLGREGALLISDNCNANMGSCTRHYSSASSNSYSAASRGWLVPGAGWLQLDQRMSFNVSDIEVFA